MWRLMLALMMFSKMAAAQTALDHYRSLQGHWVADHESIELNYIISEDSVRVEGEICTTSAHGPRLCEDIDHSYEPDGDQLVRDDEAFGRQPVQILQLTDTRLVTRELHPLSADHSAVTSEELVDANTLRLISETWIQGQAQPQSRQVFTLHRRN